MEVRELICIGCPLGCLVTVRMDGERLELTGHSCQRGEMYARKEILSPTRAVTSTVRVTGGEIAMVSVKTKEDIPKEKIFDAMQEIRSLCIPAPVHIGEIIIEDCAKTGIPVIATKNVGLFMDRDQ